METSKFHFINSFLTAIFKLGAVKLTHMVSLLSFTDKHGFTPLPMQKRGCGGIAQLAIFDAVCCHELYHTLLFDIQFVPCCTTKYIFWLGKNKFDRGGHRAERCQYNMVDSYRRIEN